MAWTPSASAVRLIVASFPVYRTYIDMDGAQEDADRRDLDWAMAQARRGDSDIDPSVFDYSLSSGKGPDA